VDLVCLNAEVFGKKQPFFGQTRIIRDGEVRWITAESIPRDLPDGSTVWEGVLIDVTDRVRAQQRLEESESRLRKILDHIPVPLSIYESARDQRITFVNETFVRTFGYTLPDLPTLGRWLELAYPDPDYRHACLRIWTAAVEQALAEQTPVDPLEFVVTCKDGKQRHVVINAVPLDELLLVGFLDITQR
jgi:PAS domain S-box-containing protein